MGSLVRDIKDLLSDCKTAVVGLKFCLVEGLWLVELVAVGGPHHVTPLVLLSLPGGAVTLLPVAGVPTLASVGTGSLLQLGVVVERDAWASTASTPVGLVLRGGRSEAQTSGRLVVARRLEVCCVCEDR